MCRYIAVFIYRLWVKKEPGIICPPLRNFASGVCVLYGEARDGSRRFISDEG